MCKPRKPAPWTSSPSDLWGLTMLVSIPPTGATMAQQRINKSGNQSWGYGGQSVQITGWTPDGTNPGTVSGNGLQVAQAGSGVATGSIQIGGGTVPGTVTLRKNATTASNGTQLGTVSAGPATGVYTITTGTITLAAGDIITLWYTVGNDMGKTVTAASTFIDWLPV